MKCDKAAVYSIVFAGIDFLGWIAYWIVWYYFQRELLEHHGMGTSTTSYYLTLLKIIGLFSFVFGHLGVAFGAIALSRRQYSGLVAIVLAAVLFFANWAMPMWLSFLMR